MATISTLHLYIETLEDVCSGEPVLKGTRIAVKTIIGWVRKGKEVEDIVTMYPNVNHAMVYDALSYYYDHKDEIDSLLRENTIEHQQQCTEGEDWRSQSYTLMKT